MCAQRDPSGSAGGRARRRQGARGRDHRPRGARVRGGHARGLGQERRRQRLRATRGVRLIGVRPAKARAPMADGVVLLNGADLTPQPVSWLWRDWFALGKLHILAGAPGQGKTTIALAMAATVTSGGRWPDGSHCDAGHVLIWSARTTPPTRCCPPRRGRGRQEPRALRLWHSYQWGVATVRSIHGHGPLAAQASRIGDVRLIVVDPVVSAVTGDSHKNTEVRRALQPFVDLASTWARRWSVSRTSAKVDRARTRHRVSWARSLSPPWPAWSWWPPRSRTKTGQDRRILARGKSNIGPDDGGFEYSIAQVEALPGIQASRIDWGAAVEGSARELLTDPAEDSEEGNAQDSAAEFLRHCLPRACW